jgi:hypothetical protein
MWLAFLLLGAHAAFKGSVHENGALRESTVTVGFHTCVCGHLAPHQSAPLVEIVARAWYAHGSRACLSSKPVLMVTRDPISTRIAASHRHSIFHHPSIAHCFATCPQPPEIIPRQALLDLGRDDNFLSTYLTGDMTSQEVCARVGVYTSSGDIELHTAGCSTI